MNIVIIGSESQLGLNFKKTKISAKYNIFFLKKEQLDITNENSIINKFNQIKPDYIINCAAYTNVNQAQNNSEIANDVNNYGLKLLSKISNNFNSLLIHFSTDYVFDGLKKNKYNESDATIPLSVYGKTKLSGEKSIIHKSNNYIIIRVSWLFSEFKNNFFNFVINKLISNENIQAVNDLYSIPTSASSLTSFVFYAIENELIYKNKNSIYHFTNMGSPISWYQFASYIKKKYNINDFTKSKIIPINSYQLFSNQIRPKFSALENKKLINDFNYKIDDWKLKIDALVTNNQL